MKSLIKMLIPFAFLGLVACEQDGPMEEAGEDLDNAVEETRDEVDDAADEVGDTIEDAVDEVKESH